MHHSEKARLKQESHTGVGYICSQVVSIDEESYFYSSFDGLFRKHVFRENDAFIQLVTSHDYLVATTPEPKVPEPIVDVPKPVAPKKKTVPVAPKKKTGRKKNAE